ncbi:hypothetical protein M6B38_320965 [Iris pallida]|uniref:Uncharacterized protein n=1 Tax=Iris pallida TaxID=29817 RepID=A0AAX6HD07_IRIPA|nr:hypothetical protein M6B38_320965 [Iris pallida]
MCLRGPDLLARSASHATNRTSRHPLEPWPAPLLRSSLPPRPPNRPHYHVRHHSQYTNSVSRCSCPPSARLCQPCLDPYCPCPYLHHAFHLVLYISS